MQNGPGLRIVMTADSHLGFDMALRPRIKRRRRGLDFLANFQRVIRYAVDSRADVLVHGGDVFHSPGMPGGILDRAYQPLLEAANAGLPVFIVPGNHERSHLPEHLYLSHPLIQVFDQPRSYELNFRGKSICLAGFPFHRQIRSCYLKLLARTGWQERTADINLLCLHQTVEGASVGPVDYVFRSGSDIIPGSWIPAGFQAVLAGHIHRRQILTADLKGRALQAPVIYPGSIERTSSAERFEPKGFWEIMVNLDNPSQEVVTSFHELPARPMEKIEIPAAGKNKHHILASIEKRITEFAPDAIVQVAITGEAFPGASGITNAALRSLAPPQMNITLPRFSGNTLREGDQLPA